MLSKISGKGASVTEHVEYDEECRQIISHAPAKAIAWWLMASYLYYHQDQTILSDAMFDELSGFLAARWEEIEHPHKVLIRREDLATGSGFAIPRERYPSIVIGAACRLLANGIEPLPAVAPPKKQLSLF